MSNNWVHITINQKGGKNNNMVTHTNSHEITNIEFCIVVLFFQRKRNRSPKNAVLVLIEQVLGRRYFGQTSWPLAYTHSICSYKCMLTVKQMRIAKTQQNLHLYLHYIWLSVKHCSWYLALTWKDKWWKWRLTTMV